MKATLSIGLCTIVLLLALMQTPLANVCRAPSCQYGESLNRGSCQCDKFSLSTCPAGFTKIVNIRGTCSCERKTIPKCNPGFTLSEHTCKCTLDTAPTCPRDTSLTSSHVRCTGSLNPICPIGTRLHDCKCVKYVDRKCPSGRLSRDGCKCIVSSKPACIGGCTLNSNGCKCNRDANVQCYYNNNCGGGSIYTSLSQCCSGSAAQSRSYRRGSGSCNICAH